MNELDTEQRKEYEGLQAENNKTLQDITRAKNELDELAYKVNAQDNRLRMDNQRMKVINLKEEIKVLEAKKSDLDIQLNESNMSIPELRDRLLAKLKEDKERMKDAEDRSRDLKRATDNLDKKIRDMEDEILGNNALTENNKKKFEAMYEVEKEITEFIDNFDNNREKARDKMGQLQQTIVATLENMSALMTAMKTIPTMEDHEKMVNDLKFTQKQKDNAEETLRLVQGQLMKRQKDLEKIEQFETTLPQQLSKMKERYQEMNTEIKKFERVDQIKQEMIDKRATLLADTHDLVMRTGMLGEERRTVDMELNSKRQKLNQHDMYSEYTELEHKIDQNEQLINNIKNFIASKEQYMNGDNVIQENKKLQTQINDLLLGK